MFRQTHRSTVKQDSKPGEGRHEGNDDCTNTGAAHWEAAVCQTGGERTKGGSVRLHLCHSPKKKQKTALEHTGKQTQKTTTNNMT